MSTIQPIARLPIDWQGCSQSALVRAGDMRAGKYAAFDATVERQTLYDWLVYIGPGRDPAGGAT